MPRNFTICTGTLRCLALGLVVSVMLIGCATPNYVLCEQAQKSLLAGDIQDAENRAALALSQNATDWQAQYLMGLVRTRQMQGLAAEGFLQRALILHNNFPETPDILDALAEAIYLQGNHVKLAAFLKETASARLTARDFMRQGKYLGKIGDADGAVLAFKKAPKFADPDDASPYLAAADYYESINKPDEAILALRRGYTVNPLHITIQYRLQLLGVVPGPTIMLKPED